MPPAVDEPESLGILTLARRGIWNAIKTYPGLCGIEGHQIRKIFEFDSVVDLIGMEPNPSMSEVPALAIWPGSSPTPWDTNQTEKLAYQLVFQLWTPHVYLPLGEYLWEKIGRAIHQAKDPNGQNYWQRYRNTEPTFATVNLTIGSFTSAPIRLGKVDSDPTKKPGPLATFWTWPVSIDINWSPDIGGY